MESRQPGAGRFARTERERRWVLPNPPDGAEGPVHIVDLYLRQTQLRLRRMEAGGTVVRKLGQKVRVRPESPRVVQLTNMYLTEQEYVMLARLGGARVEKTRWHCTHEGRQLSVDVFEGDLAGLVLAEVELESDRDSVNAPAEALTEVSDDDRFSGGALASLTRGQAAELLTQVAHWR